MQTQIEIQLVLRKFNDICNAETVQMIFNTKEKMYDKATLNEKLFSAKHTHWCIWY